MKKISIIIPVFNCEKYIIDCLDSVNNQSIDNKLYEVIIVNDGSKDNSESLIKDYIKDKKNYILIGQKNKGLSEARNNGLIKSKGDYIFFLDGDDTIPKKSLELLYNNITKYDCDVVIGGMENYNSIGTYDNYTKKYIKNTLNTNYKKYKNILNLVHAPGKLYKKEVINDIKFIKNVKHEDNYFTLSIYLNCNNINIIDAIVYNHRIREGKDKSITQTLDINSFKDLLINYNKLIDENKINKTFAKYFIRKIYNYIIKYLSLSDYIDVKNNINIVINKITYTYSSLKIYNFLYKNICHIYLSLFKNRK